jgi:hypothetical protein
MRYESMISDFFFVYDAINHIVPSQFEDLEFWDTDLTKLLVQTATATYTFDYAQLSTMLDVPELKMQNFLVVHFCLSNHLNLLFEEKAYQSWDVKDSELVVSFHDGSIERFQSLHIGELMSKTESNVWQYQNLVDEEAEMHARD